MSNETLLILAAILTFSCLVVMNRAFGKAGLFAWAALVPVLANILTAKQITVFGLDATMGTVLFASMFLCTDIMSEIYGHKEARRAAAIGVAAVCGYIAVTQIALLFIPNAFDYASGAMETIFATSLRISVASLVCFAIANVADVYLFEWLKKKQPQHLWLRNNVATIVCNVVENFVLMFISFYGIFTAAECVQLAVATSIIEIIVCLLDTPFVYIARKWKQHDEASA